MISKSLPLLSLLFLVSCDSTTVGQNLEELGNDVESVSENIQSSGDDLLNDIIDDTTDVYIAKGNTQCNDDGLTLAETTSYLTDANIDITESQCGVIEGVAFASVCGGGTADIYVHTIKTSDLINATNIGFTETSLLTPQSLTYSTIDCPF